MANFSFLAILTRKTKKCDFEDMLEDTLKWLFRKERRLSKDDFVKKSKVESLH